MNASDPRPDGHVLVIGSSEIAAAITEAIEEAGGSVEHLDSPTDALVAQALRKASTRSVAVVDRDDVVSLRLALLVEYVRPDLPLLVTIFDRTIARQLVSVAPNVQVLSLADVVVPGLVGPCVSESLLALSTRGAQPVGIVQTPDGPAAVPIDSVRDGWWTRLLRSLASQLRPPDAGARLLLAGLLGLAGLFLVDLVLGVSARDESVSHSFYAAATTIATLFPNTALQHRPGWDQVLSGVMVLASLVLTAMFTAGLVDRMLGSRLVTLVGRRTIPRSGHVIVVGLGQVGLRLCLELRALGVGVVAVERDREAPNTRLAQALGIPVILGRGGDGFLLRRLSVRRARALAAVTSDELENIAVVMAALAARPGLPVVLRAGGSDAVSESRALFRIAYVRDVLRLGGACLAAILLGRDAEYAFADERDGRIFVHLDDGSIEPFTPRSATG